jgi:membrane protease YdiL (CAAX protease family)
MSTTSACEPVPNTALAERRSAFRDVPWRARDVVFGLAPLVVGRVGLSLIDPAMLSSVGSWLWVLVTAVAMAWMLGYPLIIARRRGVVPRLARPRAALVEALFALLALGTAMVTLTVLTLAAASILGESALPEGPWQPLGDSPSRPAMLALFVLAVLAAPIAEEATFRGMLYNALRSRLHPVLAVPIQAVIFAAFHNFDLARSAIIAFLGVCLAIVYECRKTLLAPMFLHALVNGVAIVMMLAELAALTNGPMLGVFTTQDPQGCRIEQIATDSAADEAGLRIGDVITAVDRQRVTSRQALGRIVRNRKIGDTIPVNFLRDGQDYEVDVVLRGRPKEPRRP